MKRGIGEVSNATEAGPAKRIREFDGNATKLKVQRNFEDDLLVLQELKDKKDEIYIGDICSFTCKDDNYELVIKGLVHDVPNATYENVEVDAREYMDSIYKKCCDTRITIKVQVLTSPIRPVIESVFEQELKQRKVPKVSDFALKVKKFIETHPHKDYPYWSFYLTEFETIFTEKDFILWPETCKEVIMTLFTKYDLENKEKSLFQLAEKRVSESCYGGYWKVRGILMKKIKEQLNIALQKSRNLLKNIDFTT